MTNGPSPRRRRDSAASRERLLQAATELFNDRGFDRTTARDIGERAGVDAAMIARYFGGKAQLFIEVLRTEDATEKVADLLEADRLAWLLDRTGRRGPGPVLQAGIRPYDDPKAQQAALAELHERTVTPLRERLAEEGDPDAALRAEVLVAALIGVIVGRHAGTFEHLSKAGTDEVLPLLRDMLDRR